MKTALLLASYLSSILALGLFGFNAWTMWGLFFGLLAFLVLLEA
jgi:hypothetical protein